MFSIPAFGILVISSMTLLHLTEGLCPQHYVGDGYCDDGCNNRYYRFDDGDCCENTCLSRPRSRPCGVNGYRCRINVPVPSWFTRDTQLCYKWRPDGDGGQCGGVSSVPMLTATQPTIETTQITGVEDAGCNGRLGEVEIASIIN